ncbi:MAG: prephenate dehydrogenase/arogenate dehydrogenase family protein, partial [Chitinophagaceae bacterium]|nr:prephenate dehydrogenase/arogenate dehydrogenase family protein [Chitinophagaceae bacterium]
AMWVPIFMQNKVNVLDVLTEHIAQLTRFKESIENEDTQSLQTLISDANKIRRILK